MVQREPFSQQIVLAHKRYIELKTAIIAVAGGSDMPHTGTGSPRHSSAGAALWDQDRLLFRIPDLDFALVVLRQVVSKHICSIVSEYLNAKNVRHVFLEVLIVGDRRFGLKSVGHLHIYGTPRYDDRVDVNL